MALPSLKEFNKKAEEQPLIGLLVYSVLNFIRPVIQIFLIPLYLSLFTESEYGIYDLMFITGSLLMVVLTFRINAAMLTVYYDYIDDRQQLKRYLRSLFSTSIIIALTLFTLLNFFGEALFDLMFKSEEIKYFPYGILVVGYAMLGEINACYMIYLRNEKDLVRYFIVILSQILGAILFQVLFIVVFKMGVVGALIGYLIANAVTFILILFMERGIITLDIDKVMIKKSLKFSLALIPFLLIYWVLTKGGKIVLERYADLSTVAVYALLVTVGSVIILLVEAVINGVRPFLFEIFARAKGSEAREKIDILTRMIINLPLFAIPVIVLLGNNIGILTSKTTYHEVAIYTTSIALATYMLVYGKMFYQQLLFLKRSDTVTLLSFIVVVFLVSGLYYFVPIYKIWGVLFVTFLANALMAILFYVAAQRQLPIRYPLKEIYFFPFLVFVILFLLEYLLVYNMEVSRSAFGIVQFFVLSLLALGLNWKSMLMYKAVFLKK